MVGSPAGIGWLRGVDQTGGHKAARLSSSESLVHERYDGGLSDSRYERTSSETTASGGGGGPEFHRPVGLVPPASVGGLGNARARLSAGLRIEVDQSYRGSPRSVAGAEGPGSWASGGVGTSTPCGSSTPGMLVFWVHTKDKKKEKTRRPCVHNGSDQWMLYSRNASEVAANQTPQEKKNTAENTSTVVWKGRR